MSAVKPSLTPTELAALQTPCSSRLTLLTIPLETPFATARVGSGVAFPLKDIPVTGASAAWTSAREGMTVWIGSTALAKDKGVFFVRKAPISGMLYIGEIHRTDMGLAASEGNLAPIGTGDYITIWETYNLHAMRSVIAYSYGTSGTFYKNTDLAYTTQNEVPKPYIQATPHAGVRLPDGEETISQSYTALALPFRSGQSIASYAWTIPGSWTVTAGSIASASFTADIPQGFHTIYCTATTNDGASETIVRLLWVYTEADAIPLSQNYSDSRDRTGRRLTVQLEDDLRGDVDTENMVLVVEEASYVGGAAAPIG